MDQCQICQSENGIPYNFYYGTKKSYSSGFNRITTNYTANGTVTTYICDNCIRRFDRKKALIYLIIAAVLFILGFAGIYSAWLFAIPFFIASIVMFIASLKPKPKDAELLAIKLGKSALLSQGFNEFYTTTRYNSLFRH